MWNPGVGGAVRPLNPHASSLHLVVAHSRGIHWLVSESLQSLLLFVCDLPRSTSLCPLLSFYKSSGHWI